MLMDCGSSRAVQGVADLVEMVGVEMAVLIQRHGRRPMPQHRLHDLDAGAGAMARLAALCLSS